MKRKFKNKEIVFYTIADDMPTYWFQTIWQIVDFRKMEHCKKSYDIVYQDLINAMRKEVPTTNILGVPCTVYLFDIFVDDYEDDDELFKPTAESDSGNKD